MGNKYYNADVLSYGVCLYSKGHTLRDVAKICNNKFYKGEGYLSKSLVQSLHEAGVIQQEKTAKENIDRVNTYLFGKSQCDTNKCIKIINAGSIPKCKEENNIPQDYNCKAIRTYNITKPLKYIEIPNIIVKKSLITSNNNTSSQKAIENLDRVSLLKTIETLQKKILETQLNKQNILDTIKQSIASVKPTKIPTIKINDKLKEEVVCLDISDVHIGEKVTLNETAGHEEYNFEIFKKRIDILTEGIIKCINVQRKGANIKNLHINMLGDMCTGECIFRGQQRQIDLPLHDQIFKGADVLVNRLILPLCKIFNKITIRTVGGNHGRLSKPGEYAWNSSSDFFLYNTMKLMLQNQKNCEFLISDSQAMVYELAELPGIRHLLIHGHQAKSWNGIPYYAINRLHMRYVDLMSFPINYIHLGHFHSSGEISNVNGETLFNGAWFATNDFSLNVLSTKSIPKQRLYGMNHRGIIWTRDIMLSEPKILTINDKGTYTPLNNY